jgi:DNA topoisomerase-1
LKRILVICEKPTAAERVAHALDDGGAPREERKFGVSYFISRREGVELLVVSALGHLFTVAGKGRGLSYPIFETRWIPVQEKTRRRASHHLRLIEVLAGTADEFVSACDYDMEGSLIAYNILAHILQEERLRDAGRMRFSSLTKEALVEAWGTRSSTLDYPMIMAGKARHEVDWIFGINLSRALMNSVKRATGNHRSMSIGRVQGPTLNFVREREVAIRTFVPTPFWSLEAYAELDGRRYRLEYEGPRIVNEREAIEIASKCDGGDGYVETLSSVSRTVLPPPPFSLGDLQLEAHRLFGYSPAKTLKIAESLYLKALISYPRTSSQRIPPSIDPREILSGLRRIKAYWELIEELLSRAHLRIREGMKDDPAHPAIHPTGYYDKGLRPQERSLFDLICRRFMASMGDPAHLLETDALIDVGGYHFHLRGRRTIDHGWTRIYTPSFEEEGETFPPLETGGIIRNIKVRAERRTTRPPTRFDQASLLKLMEREEIGTKSTRSEIIETLYKRGYIEGASIRLTELGLAVVDALSQYCPEILSPELTRYLEKQLERIQASEITSDHVVEDAVERLKPPIFKLKERELQVGLEISIALRSSSQVGEYLGPCPKCKTGEMRIIRNMRTGKRFAGCSNFLRGICSNSFPLPQRGEIKACGEACPICGAPLITLKRGKTYKLCINQECTFGKEGRKHGRKM